MNTGYDRLDCWGYTFWIYYYDYTDNPQQVGHDAWASHATSVEMYDGDDLITSDVAWCSVNDFYDKRYGAELALKRILDQIEDTQFVQDVWKEFNKLG